MIAMHGPYSRRRVLAASARLIGGAALANVAAAAAAACGGRLALPATKTTPALALTVAVPSGGAYAPVNEAVQRGIDTALPAVTGIARGRYTLEVMKVEQKMPEPNRPPASQGTTIAPLLGSGTPPDLMVFTTWANPGYLAGEFSNVLDLRFVQALDDHLKGERTLALNDFFPAALDVCRHKGKLMGIPLMATPLALVYDRKRFELAGVAKPTNAWDWNRLLETARRLTRDTDGDGTPDEYGFFPGLFTPTLLSFIWQNGGEVISADGKRATLTEPAAREAIEFFAGLYRGANVSPPPPAPGTPSGWRFDREGIRYAGRWWLAMAYAASPNWNTPPDWPLGGTEPAQGKRRASALGVMAVAGLSAKTKDPAVAATALAALAEKASREVVPPARKQTPQAIQALEPNVTLEMAQAMLNALGYGRVLVLGETRKTQQVHFELNQRLILPLQRGTRTPSEAVQFANDGIQQNAIDSA